jgi:hypothetical protein
MFGIASCSHVFSGAEKGLRGKSLIIPLKRLDDQILCEWYFEHHKEERGEPVGHDVSGAFDFPYIKYCDPKPKLRSISVLNQSVANIAMHSGLLPYLAQLADELTPHFKLLCVWVSFDNPNLSPGTI